MGDIGGYEIMHSSGLIAQGRYGSVYKAQNKETGGLAAVKRIIIPSHDFESRLKSVTSEIKYVKLLGDKHRHILKIIKIQEEEDGPRLYLQIVTEYCTLRDLEYYALKYYLTICHRLKIMYETASALAFMHGQNPSVLHRDIKPCNILVTEENGQHVVRLADFGLARSIEGSRSVETENYMAPEQFDETNVWLKWKAQFSKSGAQDAFAFGVLCYQLIQSNPFKGLECPEVTSVIIGEIMMRIGEVEAEVDRSREERERSMSWIARMMESHKNKMEKDSMRREDIWKIRNLKQSLKMETTKSWNPIMINEIDSPPIRAAKEVIQSVLKFDPRERSSMAEVETWLGHIIKDMGPQPGPPVLMTATFKTLMQYKHHPAMDLITSHKLEFRASVVVIMGFSSRGVIIEYEDTDNLVLLSLTDAGYSKVWEKPCPVGFKSCSDKYYLSDGNIVLRQDNVTVVYDGDLNPIHTHTGDYGRSCRIVQNHDLLYGKQSGDKYALEIYDFKSHQHVCRLPVSVMSDWISIASHPASGWFVITDWEGKTMYMFTSDYQLHMQVQLGFRPDKPHGVCCVDNLIAVVSWSEMVLCGSTGLVRK